MEGEVDERSGLSSTSFSLEANPSHTENSVHRYLPSGYRSEVLWLQSSEHSRICGYLLDTEMKEESFGFIQCSTFNKVIITTLHWKS